MTWRSNSNFQFNIELDQVGGFTITKQFKTSISYYLWCQNLQSFKLIIFAFGILLRITAETCRNQDPRSADIVMMTEKLHRLPQCVRLCRYALRIERLNIAIPCLLKLLQASVAMVLELRLWVVVLADLGTLLLAMLLGVSILSPSFWSNSGHGFLTVTRTRRFRRRFRQYEQFG